ncbi:MAG TPA: sulfite oxidase [Longimicrobiaceae bacterium]|nr:sulfite oxidase [Longimicrobiaceae bacterium]
MRGDGARDEDRVVIRPSPLNAETPESALPDEITPAGRHFVRTHFGIPLLDRGRHRIAVDGAVRERLELELGELSRLPGRSVALTLECAGNDRLSFTPLPTGELWGGGAVGTAVWGGVPLREVLSRAGLAPGAREVVVEGADAGPAEEGEGTIHFARALPVKKALDPDTLLALEMNGAPIPREHGAPARLIVPGWYGMASVKWVTRITVLTEPFRGYFQRDRYVYDYGAGGTPEPVAEIRVKAAITAPRDGDQVPVGPVLVCGWAWSGAAPVSAVEVAADGGDTWDEARMLPASSRYRWQRWEYAWEVRSPGRHTLRVRARDDAGRTQPDAPRWNRLGYGANGVRTIVVTAR